MTGSRVVPIAKRVDVVPSAVAGGIADIPAIGRIAHNDGAAVVKAISEWILIRFGSLTVHENVEMFA